VIAHLLERPRQRREVTLVEVLHEVLLDAVAVYGVQNAFGLLMSLNMLIETPRGFDYTGEDCQCWLREVGFGETYVERLVGPDSIVVGIK
jgi:hypothetical protein